MAHPLRAGGADELLTLDNAEAYARLMYDVTAWPLPACLLPITPIAASAMRHLLCRFVPHVAAEVAHLDYSVPRRALTPLCRSHFVLEEGIAAQLNAFRIGFCKVFPMERLSIFTPEEVLLMLCGEQDPNWTRDDLMAYTETKHGYSHESQPFLDLVEVLVEMETDERKVMGAWLPQWLWGRGGVIVSV